jgi:3-oxoadipate CoA-transferase beta subunit
MSAVDPRLPEVQGLTREQVARRAAQDIADGSYVNLGIGMPELIADFIPAGREIVLHTENGLLGMGPPPDSGLGDPELINAGKRRITAKPGAAYFHHADSFAMIRGGHLDLSVLGALEVAANGDLANWSTGRDDAIPAVGGAMDLVSGVKSVYVMTSHCHRDGRPKLVERCSYPLTGAGVVNRIYTDLAVVAITPEGFEVIETAPGVSLEAVAARTAAPLRDARADHHGPQTGEDPLPF